MDSGLRKVLLSDGVASVTVPLSRSIQISSEAPKIVFNYLVALQDKQLTKCILEEKFAAGKGSAVADVSAVEMIEYFLQHCDCISLTRLKKILNATLTASPKITSSKSLQRAKRKQSQQPGSAIDSSDEDKTEVTLEQAEKHAPKSVTYSFSYLDTWIVGNALWTCFSIALATNLTSGAGGDQNLHIPSRYEEFLTPADRALFTAYQLEQMETEMASEKESAGVTPAGIVIPSMWHPVATSRMTQSPVADSAVAQVEHSDEHAAEYSENIDTAELIASKKLRLIQKKLRLLADLCLVTKRFVEKAPSEKTLAILRWLNYCYDQTAEEDLEQHFRQSLFKGELLSIETIVTYFLCSASKDTLNRLEKKVNNFYCTMQSAPTKLTSGYCVTIQETCTAIVQVFMEKITKDALANQTRYAFFLAKDRTLFRLEALMTLHKACQPAFNAMLTQEQRIIVREQAQANNILTLKFFQQFYYDNTNDTLADYFPSSQMGDDLTQQIIYFFLRNCAIDQSSRAGGLSGLTAYFTAMNSAPQSLSSQNIGHCQKVLECFERYIIRSAVGTVDFYNPLSYADFLAHYAEHAQAVMRKARACDNPDEYYAALSALWDAATALKRSYDQNHPSVLRPVISTGIADVVPLKNISRAKKLTAVAATINYFFLLCVYIYFNWRFVLQSLLDIQRWLDIYAANVDDDADAPNLTDVTSNLAEDITSMIALLFSLNELGVLLMTHTPLHNVYAFLIRAKQIRDWPRKIFIEAPIFSSRLLMHISSGLAVAALINHYVSKEKGPLTIAGFSTMMTLSLINTIFFATPAHTHQTVFNPFIFKSIRATPELSLQAGAMLLGFACAQALVITMMAEQSAVLLSDTQETNPYVLATMLAVAIIVFLGSVFSQAAAIFHQLIHPEYLVLTKDDYILSQVRPIQKSRLLWDITKQFVFRDAILIAMLAMLIQGDFAKPSALRLFFVIFISAFIVAQLIYCSYRRQLLDNLIALNPHLKMRLNPDDMKTSVRLGTTQKAKQAIDTQISKLTQIESRLPWYKLVMSYISALNRALILPFAVMKFNNLLDYFDCALDVEQMIAMTVLLGLYLMNWTVTYHHKRMHTTADFVRLLHNMKLLKSEDVRLNEGTPLLLRRSLTTGLHRGTRGTSREARHSLTHTLPEQAAPVTTPSFFKALRLNLTGSYYQYSVSDWLELDEINNHRGDRRSPL